MITCRFCGCSTPETETFRFNGMSTTIDSYCCPEAQDYDPEVEAAQDERLLSFAIAVGIVDEEAHRDA